MSPYKLLIPALMLLTSASVFAANNVQTHFQASSIVEVSKGQFRADQLSFTVTDWKIAQFLECAKSKYPQTSVYLLGEADANSTVINAAYLCTGDDGGLGSCAEQDQKWFCP